MKEKEIESDLALIEIAGEDDSLLPQIQRENGMRQQNQERSTSHNNDSHFTCSPFLNVRSSVSNTDSSMALPSGGHIDENVSGANKSETSHFSTGPQQIKRKRKGVGYNLRKSLAWNRAFFTEEGVLNPSELSMISGNLSSSNSNKLLGIQEEEPESSYGDFHHLSDSADFHSGEEKLYKELPTNTPTKGRKIGCDILPKNASSNKDNVSPDLQLVSFQVKHKVLSVQDINRSGSKRSGCPRPVAPSVKKPATTNTKKAANTEAHFSRIPSYKHESDPSLIRRTAKHCNVSESDPKITQTSQRAIVQKNKITKGPAINTKSEVSKAKDGTKTSIYDARRNLTGSLPKKNSTILHRRSPTKARLGTGAVPRLSACHSLSDQAGGSSKIAVSLPVHASCTDGNMQESHIQTSKPSGLRMPSPSLHFFSQGKVAATPSPLKRDDQSKKHDISNFSNASTVGFLKTIVEPRLPPVPKKLRKLVNDVATRRNIIPFPSTVHSKGVVETNFQVCVANNDCQFISRPKPELHVQDVSEDVTVNSLVDNALNVAKDVKYLPTGDTIPSSLDSSQAVEFCHSRTNSEIKHERPQIFQNSYMESDRACENQTDNAAAALDLKISNVYSETRKSSHVVEKVDFPEGLKRQNGDAAECIGLCRSRLESYDHCFKDKLENASSCEDCEVDDFIEKSYERVIRCPKDLYPVVLNDSNAQLGDLENQNSQFEDGKVIVSNDHELFLEDEVLHMTTKINPTVCSDAKIPLRFIEPCVVSESENSNDFTQASSVLPNSASNERKIFEQTSVKELITGPLASATIENFDSLEKIVFTLDDLPRERTTLNSESSVTVSNSTRPNATILNNPSKSCLLSNDPESSPDSTLLEQTRLGEYIGHKEQNNPIALEDNVTTRFEIDATASVEMLGESTTAAYSVPEETNVHVKSMESSPVIKPPPSAAPFSEEWLAAFEAAGEEILTKKSGAVQNSPPDKPQAEPGPWSPVRKKHNQGIGPYDCTKYTNIPLPPDS